MNCQIKIHVQPNAKRSEVVGFHGDAIKIRIKAPPVDGKANDEIVRFLSEILEIPKRQICLLHGESGRQKLISIEGMDRSVVEQKMQLKK